MRVLISNMRILFSNSSPKIAKSGIFAPKFRYFCFFVKFWKWTNLRMMISNMTILFLKFLPKNTEIKHFWSKIPKCGSFGPKFRHFIHQILQLDKFEGIDFKYNNRFLKFYCKNTQAGIFGSKFRHYCFFVKFCK